jgi:hypothetical protein
MGDHPFLLYYSSIDTSFLTQQTRKNMKIFKIILLVATVSAALNGCGGSVSATIGGTVTGLASGNSVGLTNNSDDTITYTFSSSSETFTFDKTVSSGSSYDVTVTTQPTGQVCTVSNASGTVSSSGSDVNNVLVTCVIGSSTDVSLTASVTGLDSGAELVLTDVAAGKLTITGTSVTASGGTATENFPTSLAPDAIYDTTITTQPTNGQTCSILNSSGAGTIPTSGDPSPVAISCV